MEPTAQKPGNARLSGSRSTASCVIGGVWSLQHLRPWADAYRAAGERAGHPGKLRLGISTHLYVGADPTAARAVYP